MSQKWGHKEVFYPPALWDSIPSRLKLCVPVWPQAGSVPALRRRRANSKNSSNGEEGTHCGGPQTILLCQHWLFIGSCPEALFEWNTTESEVQRCVVFFFFNCFQKFMFLPGVCAILNAASFSGVWVRAGADQMEAGACPGHRISLCIPWLSGCVLGGGSRLPHFPHGSENPALCYGTVS